MSINEIRLRNFKELKDQFLKKEASEGIPEKGSQKRFAEFVGISPAYVSNILHGSRIIGTNMAREIEGRFKCPKGWMDTDHLSGTIIMDKMAHEFGKQAMKLYQRWPEEVRALLMNFAIEKMTGEGTSSESPEHSEGLAQAEKPTTKRKR